MTFEALTSLRIWLISSGASSWESSQSSSYPRFSSSMIGYGTLFLRDWWEVLPPFQCGWEKLPKRWCSLRTYEIEFPTPYSFQPFSGIMLLLNGFCVFYLSFLCGGHFGHLIKPSVKDVVGETDDHNSSSAEHRQKFVPSGPYCSSLQSWSSGYHVALLVFCYISLETVFIVLLSVFWPEIELIRFVLPVLVGPWGKKNSFFSYLMSRCCYSTLLRSS